MKWVLRLILAGAVIAAGFWLWTFLFPSPETVIRHQLNKLAAKVSFSSDEGTLARMASAETVADFFASNVEVNIDVPGYEQQTLAGRDEITQAALGSRQAVKWLSVKFPDINVTVAPGKESAVADVTVEVNSPNESVAGVQEMKISFQQTERRWLIDQVKTVRSVSEPALK